MRSVWPRYGPAIAVHWRANELPPGCAPLTGIIDRTDLLGDLNVHIVDYKTGSHKPAKLALARLYDLGYLMVHHRENFPIYYDLTERVLGKADKVEKSVADYQLWATERSFAHLGLATTVQASDYYRLRKRTIEAQVPCSPCRRKPGMP